MVFGESRALGAKLMALLFSLVKVKSTLVPFALSENLFSLSVEAIIGLLKLIVISVASDLSFAPSCGA